jgi:glycosyltransferase involved in cell wall biosynthesis
MSDQANLKVSIVTTCFNAAQAIEPTIQSVVNQDYPNIEYIVIDGASKDGTVDILQKYANAGQLKFISEPDSGVYNAMNKALKLVTGDYVYFIGAGDVLVDATAIARVIVQADKTDILLAAENVVDAKGNFIYIKSHEWVERKQGLLYEFIAHQATFVKTSLAKQVGFDEQYKICADYDQILKLVFKYGASIKYIPEVIANYPTDGKSGVSDPERAAKVNQEFEAVRAKYRTPRQALRATVIGSILNKLFVYGYLYLRAVINLGTAWLVIFYWLFLKLYLGQPHTKKVLIWPEFSRIGGTRTYLKMLIDYYQARGFAVAAYVSKDVVVDEAIANYLSQRNVQIFRQPTTFLNSSILRHMWAVSVMMQTWYFVSASRQFGASKHVISATVNTEYLAGFLVPKPTLMVLHTYAYAKLGYWMSWLIRLCLSKTKQIVTVSNHAKQVTESVWGFSSVYISALYNYVGKRPLPPQPHNTVNVVAIGMLEDYKAPHIWAKAAIKFVQTYPNTNVEFLWAGSGKLYPFCVNLVKDYPQIKFLGMLNERQLDELYSVTDIYVQPSRVESFGINAAEAMMAGIPVIVSANGALPEISGGAEHGATVVGSEDIDLYVAAIAKLIQSPELRAHNGQLAADYAQRYAKVTWEESLDKLHLTI